MKIPRPTTPTDRRPYRIKGPARILIVSDIHVPFHDPGAIEASIDFAQSQGEISHVLVNGDLLDAYHLSTFEKDPKVRRLSEEIDQAIQILQVFAQELPGVKMIFKLGNHEARFDRYLRTNAPALADLPEISLEDIFRKRIEEVEVVEEWRNIVAGRLLINHGHEVGRGSGGQHPAKWLVAKTGTSAICGHFHRTDSWTSRDALGRPLQGWTTGALCQLSPDYLPRNQWNHGAAFVDVRPGGGFHVTNKIFHA